MTVKETIAKLAHQGMVAEKEFPHGEPIHYGAETTEVVETPDHFMIYFIHPIYGYKSYESVDKTTADKLVATIAVEQGETVRIWKHGEDDFSIAFEQGDWSERGTAVDISTIAMSVVNGAIANSLFD